MRRELQVLGVKMTLQIEFEGESITHFGLRRKSKSVNDIGHFDRVVGMLLVEHEESLDLRRGKAVLRFEGFGGELGGHFRRRLRIKAGKHGRQLSGRDE